MRLLNIGVDEFIEEEVDHISDDDTQLVDLKETKHGGRTGKDFFPAGIPNNKYFVTPSGDVYAKTGVQNEEKKVLRLLSGFTNVHNYNSIHFYHHPETEDGRDRPKEIHSYKKKTSCSNGCLWSKRAMEETGPL